MIFTKSLFDQICSILYNRFSNQTTHSNQKMGAKNTKSALCKSDQQPASKAFKRNTSQKAFELYFGQ